jgi:SAM-dependent methyltransferase
LGRETGQAVKRPSDHDIAQYFDDMVDCCAPRRDPAKRPQVKLAQDLLQQIVGLGIAGKSVLDVGCGRGELSFDILRAGASRVTGIDLGEHHIALARRMAQEDGVADRAEFRVGSGVDDLPPHDVVVHHRVICCTPHAEQFLQRTIAAARSAYAFSMPRSAGVIGIGTRIAIAFENANHALRRRGFRAFVHDEAMVHDALERTGFRRHGRADRIGWFTAAYAR